MARSDLGVALIFVIAWTTSAAPQRDAPKPRGGTGIIRGTIVAADTREAVYDATLSLQPADAKPPVKPLSPVTVRGTPNAPTARPDAQGRFEFLGVPPGRYRIRAEPGSSAGRYVPTRHPDPLADDSTPLTISANQVLDQIVITLPRGAAITGRVVDGRGNGMAWVNVNTQEVLAGDRRRTGPDLMGTSARTDDNGSFRVFGLQPGEYLLSAMPMRSEVIISGTPVVWGSRPPLYYPGTASPAAATRIRLASGDEFGPVQFILHPVRYATIRGVVVDSQGQAAGNVSVSLRSLDQGFLPMAIPFGAKSTRSDGVFELTGVPLGEYAISINHYAPQGSLFAWVPITVEDDIDSLSIGLEPGASITGHVSFDGQTPSPLPTMYVRSHPSRAGGGGAAGAMPAADLSFKLDNQFGPILIRPDGPQGWHLKSVLQAGRDITDQPTEFASGGPLLLVVMTQQSAVLSGTVVTGAGMPTESAVVMIAEDPALWHERASTTKITATGADGQYRVEGLRPGRYLATATTREDALASTMTPAYFELLAKHATALAIGEGETKTLELKRVSLR